MTQQCYWYRSGKYQQLAEALQSRIPMQGEIENKDESPCLEEYRKVSNQYYDLFNNGLHNQPYHFKRRFGVTVVEARSILRVGGILECDILRTIEASVDKFILEAATEQGLI
jgi:hypothetical protein